MRAGVLRQRVVGAVELGVARRSGTTVEVAEAEAVRRLEPPRLQRAEVVVLEDRLVPAKRSPFAGATT